mmetsp:Transcript_12856/g.23177  ORF Transcript_12856/g.23177 Transcript_12856/m.23177 type:complete len:199 (-) Transcript_12856:93-689(-)
MLEQIQGRRIRELSSRLLFSMRMLDYSGLFGGMLGKFCMPVMWKCIAKWKSVMSPSDSVCTTAELCSASIMMLCAFWVYVAAKNILSPLTYCNRNPKSSHLHTSSNFSVAMYRIDAETSRKQQSSTSSQVSHLSVPRKITDKHGNGDFKSRKIMENHGNGRKQFGQITETVGVDHGKSRKRPSRSLNHRATKQLRSQN